MDNKELISRLIIFDGEDTSTGYVGVSDDKINTPRQYLEDHIKDICGLFFKNGVECIPEIRDNMVCFYEAKYMDSISAVEMMKFLNRYPYLTIGLDRQNTFKTTLDETPEDVLEVCKRTRWFYLGQECDLEQTLFYWEAKNYSDGSKFWKTIYDGLNGEQ